jgi:hypothetical protein
MQTRYDHTSDDGQMRYVCLVEPGSLLVIRSSSFPHALPSSVGSTGAVDVPEQPAAYRRIYRAAIRRTDRPVRASPTNTSAATERRPPNTPDLARCCAERRSP